MSRKNLYWILSLVLAVSLLPVTSTNAQDEQVTIRMLASAQGQDFPLTQAAAARFMETHPNVTVELVELPDNVDERLAIYLQNYEVQSPDVDVYMIDVIWPGDMAQHFVDLYEYGAEDVVDAHFETSVVNNTVDGKLVAIPWYLDAGILYYRTDLLEKYGFDAPPTTWDELAEMASTIQEGERAEGNQDFWGFLFQGKAYEGLTCNALEFTASCNGGTVVSNEGVITINNANAVNITNQVAGWIGDFVPPGAPGADEEDDRLMWQAGNVAFMRNWPYVYALSLGDDSAVKDKFGVAPLPSCEGGESASTLGGWQLAVSQYSEHPDVAAEFALHLASYEEQKIRAIDGAFNPTIGALYQDADVLEAAPFFGDLYDVFVGTVARPSTATAPKYSETSTLFYNAFNAVLMGETDAETAFAELEIDLEELLGFETGTP